MTTLYTLLFQNETMLYLALYQYVGHSKTLRIEATYCIVLIN